MTTLDPVRPAAVLWDMDGTLVDTEPYWFTAEHELLGRHGLEWSDELAEGLIGSDLLDAAAAIRAATGLTVPDVEIVESLTAIVDRQLREAIPWRPGARELLTELFEAGVPCALVTMSWRAGVVPVLEQLPDGLFAASITGDEVPPGRGKPQPDPYLLGAAALGVDPRDCVAIEDSPTGSRSGLAAGCRVLGVPCATELAPADGMTILPTLSGVTLATLRTLFP